eukprot:g2778.t1
MDDPRRAKGVVLGNLGIASQTAVDHISRHALLPTHHKGSSIGSEQNSNTVGACTQHGCRASAMRLEPE